MLVHHAQREPLSDMRSRSRDLPAVCAFVGVNFALLAAFFSYGWKLRVTPLKDLCRVQGRVEGIWRTHPARSSCLLNIYLEQPTGYLHLVQDDPSNLVPAIRSLQDGDSVVAFAARDWFDSQLLVLWELGRGNEKLLTYAQTLRVLSDGGTERSPLSYAASVVSFLMFFAAIFFHMRGTSAISHNT